MADNRGSIQFQDVERPKMASHDSTVLDLAFAMDCTSSMSSYIREAQQNIRLIVEEIVAKEKSDIHLALIEYRDHKESKIRSYVKRVHDFTSSVKKMKGWLQAASAHGGGDEPEAVADAWHALLKLKWRKKATKICVHIADAPPHGLLNCGDDFPNGCPKGIDPVDVMNQLAEKGVTLYMVGCEPSVNASRPFYMAMAHLTGGQYVPLTNATLLSKVIIGGAEEELSLEKLMAEVEEEVRQEREQRGDEIDEEEVSRRMHARFRERGERSKQLCRNNVAMDAAPEYARAMSKMTSLSAINTAMKSITVESSVGYLSSAPMGRAPRTMHVNKTRLEGQERSESANEEESEEAQVVEPTSHTSTSLEMTDDYNVEEEELNMAQAQRMVQKAIYRTKMK